MNISHLCSLALLLGVFALDFLPIVQAESKPSLPPHPAEESDTLAPTPVIEEECFASFMDGSLKACYGLVAGQYYAAGTVCVEFISDGNGDEVEITYDTTGTFYCLTEIHAFLGKTIPLSKAGHAKIEKFPARAFMIGSCIKSYTLTTLLSPPDGCTLKTKFQQRVYKLAAHAHVEIADGSGGQTVWSAGPDIINPKGTWATYSEAKLSCNCLASNSTKLRNKVWFKSERL
jgi:hypothetical protein